MTCWKNTARSLPGSKERRPYGMVIRSNRLCCAVCGSVGISPLIRAVLEEKLGSEEPVGVGVLGKFLLQLHGPLLKWTTVYPVVQLKNIWQKSSFHNTDILLLHNN